ncbi:hypothetical protein ABZ464_20895 [Streptomyces sp. NPDC005820]|uniref:hypothetical protein n=1 Tax=Streptomyces sp. NPDC005820 TaxID=3157069 RepID=UPI0033E1A49B
MAPGTVREALVRYCLRPVLRSLIAYGSIHVVPYWHPDLGPAPYASDEPSEGALAHDDSLPYRTSRAPLQSGPEAWR